MQRRGTDVDRAVVVLLAWLRGALLVPVVVTLVIYLVMRWVCGGSSSECSWGLEFLLVIPVVIATFLGTGPHRVGRALTSQLGEDAGDDGRRTARIAGTVALALLSVLPGSGWPGFAVALALAALGVPTVVAWRTGGAERARRG